jgi:hypothetical protein
MDKSFYFICRVWNPRADVSPTTMYNGGDVKFVRFTLMHGQNQLSCTRHVRNITFIVGLLD